MAQYVYSMQAVTKVVPPKRKILENISLSFFPGAKIGVLGLNGAGKSTLLRIMAGEDQEIEGEARPQAICGSDTSNKNQNSMTKKMRTNVEEGLGEIVSFFEYNNISDRFAEDLDDQTMSELLIDKEISQKKSKLKTVGTSTERLISRQTLCACRRETPVKVLSAESEDALYVNIVKARHAASR